MAAQFLEAVKKGDRTAVDRMLDADPSLVSARDERGTSAVLLAHYHGKADVAATLLSRAPTLDVFEAATAGDAKRVTLLVDADRSLADAVAHDGYTPLGLAAFFKRRDVVKALLDRGASPSLPSRDQGFTPLHSAVATDAGPSEHEIIRLLLEAGADPNAKSREGATPLHTTAFTGDLESAELLLAYDDPLGVTAAFNRNLLVRINRELGGDFDIDAFGHRAVWNRDESRDQSERQARTNDGGFRRQNDRRGLGIERVHHRGFC